MSSTNRERDAKNDRINSQTDTIIANRYRIEKRLNKRANGGTFIVSDTKNDDELKCLKIIGFSTNSRSEMKEIIREEKILSNLNCPYILKYNESFLHNEQMCIITEYCEGGDLAQRIKVLKKNGDKLSEEKVLHWLVQLLSACHYIHSRKILHRNIKPGNILIKNGMIKLGDFGISKELKDDTKTDSFIGTPYYMSPELVKNTKYNSKSDIWSIGCVLYELATFQRPFIGDGVFEIFDSIINEEAPSIVNLYSKDLNRILKKMLIKDPVDRPSAGDLLGEPLISDYVKMIIQKSLECAKTPDRMASLINSLASLGELIDEDSFGEYDEKSTLKATPGSSARSSLRYENEIEDPNS